MLGTFFKRGLRALLPTVLTLAVIVVVYNFFADNLVKPVNDGIETFFMKTGPGRNLMDSIFSIDVDAETYRIPASDPDYRVGSENIAWDQVKKDLDKVYPPIVGFILSLLLVFSAGFVLATFVGRRILSRFENVMGRFPVVKVIYPYARQVVEFLMREKQVTFNSVVAIEYPRRGLYSMGFVTGLGLKTLNEETGKSLVNVFIPSCPTPVTGWVIFVPAEEIIPLPISVDEAVRFAISGGVIIPDGQKNPDTILERFQQIEVPTIDKRPEESEDEP